MTKKIRAKAAVTTPVATPPAPSKRRGRVMYWSSPPAHLSFVGFMTVVENRTTSHYNVFRLPPAKGEAGRAFRVCKIGTGDHYSVYLGTDWGTCNCKHGLKVYKAEQAGAQGPAGAGQQDAEGVRPCRHVAALLLQQSRGRI